MRRSAGTLTTLMENMPCGMVAVGADGRISYVNPAAASMLGYQRDELIGEPIERLVLEADTTSHVDLRAAFVPLPSPRAMAPQQEVSARRRDGSLLPVQITLTPVDTDQGLQTYATIVDISDRVRAAKERLKYEAMFEMTGRGAEVGGWELDTSSLTLVWDAQTRVIHEVPPDYQPSLEESLNFYAPEARPIIQAAVSEAIERGTTWELELPFITARGRRLWVRAAGGAEWENGRAVRLFGIFQNITARKQAEIALEARTREVERSNAELEQFAYIASHDLQEPLRMVASYTELLAERSSGQIDAKAEKYMGYIVEGAHRMQRLVADLLTCSRVLSEGRPRELTDSAEVVGSILRELRPSIEDAGATVEVGRLPSVWVDPGQLRLLLENLLTNALKFREADRLPRIEVDAEEDGFGTWTFRVTDNGIGIAAEHAERVFQMFQRLHRRGVYDGTGIGLAIAKRIVERHGGRIWFESERGRGTTFLFTLASDGDGG